MKLICFLCFFIIFIYNAISQSSIYDIARTGNLEELKTLVESEPDSVNKKNEQGFSPLLLAVYHENEQAALYLMENGANVNENTSMGSPLMAAVVKNHILLAERLLKNGANVNAVDANATSSLIYAASFQLPQMVELLLANGANVAHKDNNGFTALDYADKLKNKEIVQLLKQDE